MTDLSTSNLKRLLAEATPGPWEARYNYKEGDPRPDDSHQIRGTGGDYLGIMHGTDAYLTALAPELAQEVLRMRGELTKLKEEARYAAKFHATGLNAQRVFDALDTTINQILGDQDE